MNAFLTEYLLHLFHWTWQTSLVAAVALLVVRLRPKASRRFRAAILGLAFWKFLLPPMLPGPTGLFSRIGPFGLKWFGGRLNAARPGFVALAEAIVVIHVVGIIVGLGRIVAERRWLGSILSGARRRGRVRLAVVPEGLEPRVPVAFGFLRPAILMPRHLAARLASADRRIVRAHERRHLQLAHGLSVSVEAGLGVLWWFHPLWRIVIRERRRVREERCDADVVARLGIDRAAYASCLVRVAAVCGETVAPACVSAMSGGAAGIAARVNRLRQPPSRATTLDFAATLALYAALLPGIRPSLTAPLARTSIPGFSRTGAR